jgi:hypothetical protein
MSKKTLKPKSRKEHDQVKRSTLNNKQLASKDKPEPNKLDKKYSKLFEQCKNLIGFRKKC